MYNLILYIENFIKIKSDTLCLFLLCFRVQKIASTIHLPYQKTNLLFNAKGVKFQDRAVTFLNKSENILHPGDKP